MSANPTVRSRGRWLTLGALAGAAVLAAAWLWPIGAERSFQVATGFVALALIAGSAAYGARKWMLVTRLGSLHAWMVGHLALGVALGLVVAAHADLSDLGGPGWALVSLLGVQIGSGVWALVELSSTPKRFARLGANTLAFPTTARRRLALLGNGVDRQLAKRPALREWFEPRYRPVLEGRAAALPALEGFAAADARAAGELHERATEIARLREILQRLDVAERVSTRWTWIHVPTSVALVTLVVLHVIGWLVYG